MNDEGDMKSSDSKHPRSESEKPRDRPIRMPGAAGMAGGMPGMPGGMPTMSGGAGIGMTSQTPQMPKMDLSGPLNAMSNSIKMLEDQRDNLTEQIKSMKQRKADLEKTLSEMQSRMGS